MRCVVLTAKLSSACHTELVMKMTKCTNGITGERKKVYGDSSGRFKVLIPLLNTAHLSFAIQTELYSEIGNITRNDSEKLESQQLFSPKAGSLSFLTVRI